MPSPLISTGELLDAVASPAPPTVLDVRWELGPGARPDRYEDGHLPGAAFLDLDQALSAAPGPGGRHPLPAPAVFVDAMRAAGVGVARPVVIYDAAGSLPAARAWWLLRHYGHADVRVLDGGLAAWVAAGGELVAGREIPAPGDFAGEPGAMPVIDADGATALARSGVLLDARAPERFRGDVEPLDPVAGHIPAARNLPMSDLLTPTGGFRGPHELREAFLRVGAGGAGVGVGVGAAGGADDVASVGAYCGSGITAAHTVLALEVAGLGGGALYPGSWSEWVTDPNRPVATGD